MKGLVLTYLITGVGSLVALRRPLIGLYIYIAFAVLRPQYIWGWAGDMSNMSLVIGVATILGWALNGFGSWTLGRSRGPLLAIFAYTGWNVLSATTAIDSNRSFYSLLELAKTLLPLLMGMSLIDSRSKLRPLVWVIVLAQGYVAFEMNWTYLRTGANPASIGFGGMDNNFFAVTLITVISLAFTLAIVTERWYERALAGFAGLLILHTILLTFSRGAMVGMLATGAMAFILMPKRPTNIAVLLVILLLAIRLTGPELAARYNSSFVSEEERDGSAESRVQLWMDCLRVIQQYPVLGVGPWNWRLIASSYGWSEGKSAHSLWMESAAEVGIPGAIALFTFFAFAGVRLWPLARTRWTNANRESGGLAAGVALGLVGFAVSAQFVTVTGLEVPYYLTLVGLILVRLRTGDLVETIEPAQVGVVQPGATPRYRPPPLTAPGRPRLLPELPGRRSG
jgi:putative inorganic carbon (hco3(-)) transporter